MVEYSIVILNQAIKDKEKIKQQIALKRNVEKLLEIVKGNPYQNPPHY